MSSSRDTGNHRLEVKPVNQSQQQLQLLTATNSTTKTQPLQTQFSPKYNSVRFSSETFYESFFQKQKFTEHNFRWKVLWVFGNSIPGSLNSQRYILCERFHLHSNVQFQNHFWCTHAFKRLNSDWFPNAFIWSLRSLRDISVSPRCVQTMLQVSNLFSNIHRYQNTAPERYSLTASTNVIAMHYPHTIQTLRLR